MAEKCLICNSCNQQVSITDEEFPEDLYELMFKYQLKQLSWVCKKCYNKDVKCCDFCLSLANNVEKIEYDLSTVKDTVQLLSKQFQNVTVDNSFNKREYQETSSRIPSDSPASYLTKYSPKQLSPQKSKGASELLQKVLKHEIKINDEEKANSNKVVISFLDTLRNYLKSNEETEYIFNRYIHVGSSYTDLRISSATEYDINVVLLLSPKYCIMEPVLFENTCAYAKIKWKLKDVDSVTTNLKQILVLKKFLKNTSEDHYIVPGKITAWFQSHIDNFLLKKPMFENIIKHVAPHESGPARTMDVKTSFGPTISIDLAPVFEFQYSNLSAKNIKHLTNAKKKSLYMVPKLYRGDGLSEHEASLSWRLDFPHAEEDVLHNKLCAKPVIKLLKLLRDKENWRDLASYYIKTVMLWKVVDNPSSEYWNNTFIFERLLEVMKLLHKYLQEKHLPFFFDEHHNLIYKMSPLQCENWSNRLQHIISDIDSDYNNITSYFCN